MGDDMIADRQTAIKKEHDGNLQIEVAYGTPDKQTLLSLEVPLGTSVEQAISASGIMQIHGDIDLDVNKVGVWNRTCKLDTELRDGDRIEIYRPLIADPKEVRRKRAEKAKAEGRANEVTGGRESAARDAASKPLVEASSDD